MFYLDTATGIRYYVGRKFSYNNINYTAAGATRDRFLELGFEEITIAARPDDRFYFVSGPDDAGVYTSTERDLTELKASFVLQTKAQARQILNDTDWVIIRSFETALTADPQVASQTIRDYRAAVRTASNTRCDEINAVTTVAALETLINSGLTAFPDALEESDTY